MRIGPYELEREIARGGMGVVYRGIDRALNRPVAVKVMTVDPGDREFLQRFQREAQAAARLRHPAIVAVHATGVADGRAYLVMDLIEGSSLAARLEQGPLPVREALRQLRDLADAVATAHDHGILHRDLKPGNVLLAGERALLTDFGLAKVAGLKSLTETGTALGTPQYMAPEQARGDTAELGPATDVYGLGATLYAMLTGQPPFPAGSLVETLRAVTEEAPQRPRTIRPDLDPRLEALILRCLAKEPSARFASPRRLIQALDQLETAAPRRPLGVSRALPWAVAGAAALWAGVATVAWRDAAGREAERERQVTALGQQVTALEQQVAALEPQRAEGPALADPARTGSALDGVAEDPEVARLHARALALAEAGDERGVLDVTAAGIRLAPDDPRWYCRRTLAYYELGQADEAAAAAARAVELAPDQVDPWLATAQAAQLQGDLAAAERAVTRALALAPDDPYALGLRGVFDAQRGDFDAAKDALDRAVAGEPRNPVFWLNRGRVLLALGQPGAIDDLQRARDLAPARADVLLELAQGHAIQGDPSDAGRLLDELVEQFPELTAGWITRGRFRCDQRAYLQAVEDYGVARGLEPRSPAVYAQRGVALVGMRRMLLALSDFERALELDPRYVTALINRAKLRLDAGDVGEALRTLSQVRELELDPQQRQVAEQALRQAQAQPVAPGSPAEAWLQVARDPTDAAATLALGTALARQQEFDAAAFTLSRALELGASGPAVYAQRAMAYAGLGDDARARADLEQALALDAEHALSLATRGFLALKAGRPGGLDDVERALALDPELPLAHYARGMARGPDQLEETVADYTRAIELDPVPSYRFNRGLVLHQLGRLEEARVDYQEFLFAFPNYAQAWANLGAIRLTDTDWLGAALALERALELQPSLSSQLGQSLREARRRLAR